MEKNLLGTLLTVVLSFGFTACIETTSDNATPEKYDPFAGKTRIDGPVVEGSWFTPCLNEGGYTSTKHAIVFKGSNFERTTDQFRDPYCQKLEDSYKTQGEFIFTAKNPNGTFQISYAEELGNAAVRYRDENLSLDGTNLYLSFFFTGESAPVFKNRPFKKNGWIAKECENYQGQYQLEVGDTEQTLEIQQKECESIKINSQIFLLDGFERPYSSGLQKVSIFNKLLRQQYTTEAKDAIMEQWSFQTRPCNSVQDSKETFLTKEVWINGAYSYEQCSYYKRINNN